MKNKQIFTNDYIPKVQSYFNIASNEKLPLITVSGSNEKIGRQLGIILKDRILETLNFYKKIFNREEEEIFKYARFFRDQIRSFNYDYGIEIERIAETVEVDPLWMYALNARSEIMNKFENECTASYFRSNALLGQNWDWSSELEKLAIVLRIKQDGKPDILQMTEPGIIGKIGFNSEGLGVTLNFLHLDDYNPDGVPTHVLLRGVLDCKTIDEARDLIKKYSKGRSSNFIVADSTGNYFDVEFAGKEEFFLKNTTELFLHTNHYLGKPLNPRSELTASSYSRYERGSQILKTIGNQDVDDFKALLLDKANKELPICRPYVKSLNKLLENSGTVCSIIMDLKKRSMLITKGNPFENEFEEIPLN